MKILVINCGSSSIKYKSFLMPQEKTIQQGLIEHIGEEGYPIKNHFQGLKVVLEKIKDIHAIGHRVVHGKEYFSKPVLIDEQTIRKIKSISNIAPLHNPANLAGILACKRLLPGIKQVAVFDTAFYQSIPEYAYIYALPYRYYKKYGIRRYGFHGTSHEYVAYEASRILKKPLNKLKLISCHLGNGCSITAIYKGKAIDTSMGFTPLEGLVMGTRCGDIDPSLVTYLMDKEKLTPSQIERILNYESGLKGISEISNDMRILEKSAKSNYQARLAIDIFVYRIKKYIGAYTLIMGGVDAVIFTAGIGENQKNIRELIVRGLFNCLKKPPKILVIPTNEELMIARQVYNLIKKLR